MKISGYRRHGPQKMVILKALPQQELHNVSNSGSIIGQNAELFNMSTLKVTPLSNL
jgi:hypothetical protein